MTDELTDNGGGLAEALGVLNVNEAKKPSRHCAVCLIFLEPEKAKLCGGCMRRAYCSTECQRADWSNPKKGQGHRNWCKVDCGEEDLDWSVEEVPGKGLGLIAKRRIPALYRILVDAVRPQSHPGILDLMPVNGTLKDKIDLNGLGMGDNNDETVICFRISRVNHSCNANACHWYDGTFGVKILFSERAIEAGEEICINYMSCNDCSNDRTPQDARAILSTKWGIACFSDCICYDNNRERLVTQARSIDKSIFDNASRGNITEAMQAVEELIFLHNLIGASFITRMRTFYDGFQVGIMEKRSLTKASEYIRKAYEINTMIQSPKSQRNKDYLKWLCDISSHRNYLLGSRD